MLGAVTTNGVDCETDEVWLTALRRTVEVAVPQELPATVNVTEYVPAGTPEIE
jgi:hypothetical protein